MSQLKKGAILSYVTIFLTNIVGLLLTPFIIRSLGQSEYGLYILIGSFVGYISLLDLGLNNTIVRFVAKNRANNNIEGEKNFLATIFIIYALISLLVLIIGIIFYLNLESIFKESLNSSELYKAKIMTILLIGNIAISLPGGAFTGICNGYEHFVFPRSINIIRYIIRTILVVVILSFGGKAISLVIIDTALNISIIIATAFYVLQHLKVKIKLIKFDKSQVKTIFNYSIWIFVFSMIGQLFWKSGQLILGITIDTKTVAIYAVGIVLSGYFGAFAGAINSVFLPKATFMVEQNGTREELTNMLIKIGRILAIILMYLWMSFILFGKHFVRLWVGDSYNDAYLITVIIMTAYILPLVQNFANSVIEATGKFKFKAIVYFVTISMGIILGGYLSKFYGYWAITWCYSIFWVFSQIIMNWYFDVKLNMDMKRFFKETFGQMFLTILISFAIGYLINYLFTNTWTGFIIKAISFTTIYGLTSYFLVLNEFEKKLFNPLKFLK